MVISKEVLDELLKEYQWPKILSLGFIDMVSIF